VNQDEEVPDNEAGGFIAFEYLSSGAWMVREWYIRMPSLTRDRRGRIRLGGYVDVGGRAEPLELETPLELEVRETTGGGSVGGVRGVVWDSIGDGGLEGATVSILGTDLTATTDEAGEFVFPSVPVGLRRLTFVHPEPSAWGVGSPLVAVDVEERRTSDARLAVPGFRSVASVVCRGGGLRARAVLVGDVVGADGVGLADVTLVLRWPAENEDEPTVRREVRADPDGSFVVCTIPPETSVQVDARVDGVLIRGFQVTVADRGIEYRRMQLPLGR